METKNVIIRNYAAAIINMANALNETCSLLNDNESENVALIKTINIQIESIKSQVIVLQSEIDNY